MALQLLEVARGRRGQDWQAQVWRRRREMAATALVQIEAPLSTVFRVLCHSLRLIFFRTTGISLIPA